MRNRNNIITSVILVLAGSLLQAAEPEQIPFDPAKWSGQNEATLFEEYEGRQTLFSTGSMLIEDLEFTDGTIEVDILGTTNRSFGGIVFRGNDGNYEEIYLRLHKNRQVDSVQYTPVYRHESNWQLFRQYQSSAVFDVEGWNRLKVVVKGQVAQVYLNDAYLMTIDELRGIEETGKFGIFALFGTRFSNFTYSPHAELIDFDSKEVSSHGGRRHPMGFVGADSCISIYVGSN
jgi:hypothetical protein